MLQLYERKLNNCNKKRKEKNEKKYVIETEKRKNIVENKVFFGKNAKSRKHK